MSPTPASPAAAARGQATAPVAAQQLLKRKKINLYQCMNMDFNLKAKYQQKNQERRLTKNGLTLGQEGSPDSSGLSRDPTA